jgi:hypothetical protein
MLITMGLNAFQPSKITTNKVERSGGRPESAGHCHGSRSSARAAAPTNDWISQAMNQAKKT